MIKMPCPRVDELSTAGVEQGQTGTTAMLDCNLFPGRRGAKLRQPTGHQFSGLFVTRRVRMSRVFALIRPEHHRDDACVVAGGGCNNRIAGLFEIPGLQSIAAGIGFEEVVVVSHDKGAIAKSALEGARILQRLGIFQDKLPAHERQIARRCYIRLRALGRRQPVN